MTNQTPPAAAWIAAAWIATGAALFAALAYEPANIAALIGPPVPLDEGAVVIAGLAVSAFCVATGAVKLRRARRVIT